MVKMTVQLPSGKFSRVDVLSFKLAYLSDGFIELANGRVIKARKLKEV